MIGKLISWLRMDDYLKAKENYSLGIITEEELKAMSLRADRHMENLRRYERNK